jgi:hypothetical protein
MKNHCFDTLIPNSSLIGEQTKGVFVSIHSIPIFAPIKQQK